MNPDQTASRDRCSSGVFLIDAAQRSRLIEDDAFPPGFHVALLDGNAAGTRVGFFAEIDRAMRFPDYFGRNWDAVYDCLTDLTWLPAAGYVIVVDGFDRLATEQPDQWAIALKVFHDASAFWRPSPTPMVVLLYGSREHAPGVEPYPAECLSRQSDQALP